MASSLKLLRLNTFQRIVYLVLLILLVSKFLSDKRYEYLFERSFIGLPYILLYLIPFVILVIQVLKNLYFGWLAFLIMYLFVSVFLIVDIVKDFGLSYRYQTITDYLISSIIIVGIGLSILFFIKIKPANK